MILSWTLTMIWSIPFLECQSLCLNRRMEEEKR